MVANGRARRRWACLGLFCGAGLLGAQDNSNPPPVALTAPPANAVLDKVIAEGKKGAPPAPVPAATADQQRDALLKYQQALAAAQANRPAEALRLAKEAKDLFPDNKEIKDFHSKLQREAGGNRVLTTGSARARAYLDAAFARARDLLSVGRYGEAEDLLVGVLDAAKLFSDQNAVANTRKSAELALENFHASVASGAIMLDTPSDKDLQLVKPGAAPLAPPENLKRLLRAEGRAPLWYILHKSRLAQSMSVDYRRASVASVFDEIAEKTGASFAIDRPVALARTHINATLDLRIVDMPAETILDLACQKAGLEYVPMERAIVITTRTKAVEYARQLPDALRRNWAVGRTLFPELNPELFGSTPADIDAPASRSSVAQSRLRAQDAGLPAHLANGKALVVAIKGVLK